MAMRIEDVATLNLTAQDPASLKELLSAGKKVPPDATRLLIQDHADVKAKFKQHGSERDRHLKSILAAKICAALTVHAKIEEDIFYPEAESVLDDDDLVDEAIEEHGKVKQQIAKIMEGMAAAKPVDADVKKLMQLVEHHVQEEESDMLPDMRETDTDLYALGEQLAARRVEALISLKRSLDEAEARL